MPASTKNVFYVTNLLHPFFAERIAARKNIRLQRLDNASPQHEVDATLATAHAYHIEAGRNSIAPGFLADEQFLKRTPELLVVSSQGAGYDSIDVEACTRAGVVAVNQAGGNAEAVAEHALGMMLCLSKRIIEIDRFMRRQAGIRREKFMGSDLLGKTLGIVGIGHVGTRLSELCRAMFRMRVIACDPYLSEAEIAARGGEKVELGDLLCRSDFVSISCPLSQETRGMIGARQYALMPRHAYFITTARGGIHDEEALAQALREHRIAGAGLDVWDPEPPPPGHPLLQLDNVLASAHNAGVTEESRRNTAAIGAQQLMDLFDGRRPPRLLNPEVWPAYAKRFERILGFAPES